VVIYSHPPGAVIAAGLITFGAGIMVATAWNHWWGYWDWGHRHVYVNVNRTVNIHRTTVVHTRQIQTTTWRHDPVHRKGVAYRDPRTREKFAPANRQAVDKRRDFRGYDQTGSARPGSAVSRPDTRPGAGSVARPSTQARPESTVSRPAPETRTGPAVTRPAPEAKAAPSVTRPSPQATPAPATVARPSTQTRQAPAVSRPAPSNTIYRVEQGNKARQESARGRESLSTPKGKGESPSKASPGVSKPAPAERSSPAQGGGRQQGGGPGRK